MNIEITPWIIVPSNHSTPGTPLYDACSASNLIQYL